MGTRTGILAVVVVACLLTLVVLRVPVVDQTEAYAAEALAPLQRVLGGGFGVVVGVADTFTRATELKTENDHLYVQLEALKTADVRIQELERQNADLVAQLGYQKDHPEQKLLPANVIARDPTDLVHAITIDRGTGDGVAEGMSVVTPAGLVGRVLQVGPLSSKVLLITDSKSSVSGVGVVGRAQGMVYGRRQRQITMRYIDQMEKVEVGQWIVTSTLGGGFPPGIPIGRIVFVRQRDVEPFQEATLEPAVDFAKMDTVSVITSFVPVRRE
jgi:rod shape-determining protein MreC